MRGLDLHPKCHCFTPQALDRLQQETTDASLGVAAALAEALTEGPAQLFLLVQVVVLALPIYYALVGFTRLQVEALYLQLRRSDSSAFVGWQ